MAVARRIAATLVAVFAITAGTVALGGQSAHADVNNSLLKHWASGKCVDTGLQDQTKVILFDCHGNANQRFIRVSSNFEPQNVRYAFQSRDSQLCLGAADTPFSGLNHRVLMRRCDGLFPDVFPTVWRLVFAFNGSPEGPGWYQVLQNTKNGGCLGIDPSIAQPSNGTLLMTSPCPPLNSNISTSFRMRLES